MESATPGVLLLLVLHLHPAAALDNRVADTPPRGWCSWQRYRCHIACDDAVSRECFNERLIRDTVDAMVVGGYVKAGYEYIALDDCWQGPRRVDGHIVSDPKRFPSGIKALAAYVHAKGMKLGLYTALGNNSCAANKFVGPPPWSADLQMGLGCDERSMPRCARAQRDIEDFVSWDIDHLKVHFISFQQQQPRSAHTLPAHIPTPSPSFPRSTVASSSMSCT